MTDTYERCSCGARYKYKCSKESSSGYGKMCAKEYKAELTVLDADVAMELLDNPPKPNDKLMELLELK